MAINLSEGSIAALSSGDSPSSGVKPVLQVTDIRVVNTQNNNNNNNTERYPLLLSDGSYYQQGILATQRNDLVRSGRLAKGSIVQLTEFVCNVIQNRMIIIISDLYVILDKCEPIGEPKQYPLKADSETPATSRPSAIVHPTINQPGTVLGNPLSSSGNSLSAGSIPKENVGGSTQAPELDRSSGPQSNSSSFSSRPDSGRYNPSNVPPLYPRTESGVGISRASLNSHVRPLQPTYPQPPPMYTNRGPIVKNEAPPRIIPIAALNPYQGRWTIKARVTAKKDLIHYKNPWGEGKVFSFDLLDSDGGEIRATCFNAVADQFYHQIEVGKVYLISKGNLRPAQKNFNHLNNDNEIMLESSSTIQLCYEDDSSIPRQQFRFRSIIEIEGMENNSIIDVIGVLCFISPSSPVMRKNGTETQKRVLHLKDMSGRSVEVTLWGNFCNAEGRTVQNLCDSGVFPVLAVKSGKVSDFNGKTVWTIPASQLFIEPDFPEARQLKTWVENEGKNAPIVSISRETTSMGRTDVRKTISQIKDEKLGTSEKPDWITVCATVSYMELDNFCYTGCPIMIGDRKCSKKVTNNGDGTWRCDRCDQSVDECDYRYILQFQIQDHSGFTWVTAFQECGEEIMGISAKELYYLKYEEQDDERFSEIVRQVLFDKYIFKLKVKEETFSDEQRVKSTVIKAEKLNYISETRFILDLIGKIKGEGSLAMKSENVISNIGLNNTGLGNVGLGESAQPFGNFIGNTTAGQGIGIPASQMGQFGNPNVGSRLASTGPTGVYISCSSCGCPGHSSTNCPSAMNGQGHTYAGGFSNLTFSPGGSGVAGGGGASGECFKCHQHGHWSRDCPNVGNAHTWYGSVNVTPEAHTGYESGNAHAGGGGGASGECFKCHQHGHWARDCPNAGNAHAGYGSGNVTSGRYGSGTKQHVGGF